MFPKDEVMRLLYKPNGVKRISGFWKDSLFDIYERINLAQKNLKGNLCEIGVYCGRSFLPLANLKRQEEQAIGIDVFAKTFYHNIKNSFRIITHLIQEAFGSDSSIHILSKASKTILKDKTLHYFKPIRLFSIDGDHSVLGTLRDLIIAQEVTSKEGIIFLDDYDNPRFSPTVLEAVDIFLEYCDDWKILFTSTEKMFLCHRDQEDFYLPILGSLPDHWKIIKMSFSKHKYLNDCLNAENVKGKNSWKVRV